MTIFKTGSNIFKTSGALFSVADGVPELIWDSNGTTMTAPNPRDGSGAWLSADLWWDGATNQTWIDKAKAVIGNGGSGGSITVANPITLHTLKFRPFTGTYNITSSPDQTITLRYGLEVQKNTGTVNIQCPILLAAHQTWHNNDGILSVTKSINLNGKNLTAVVNTGSIKIVTAGGIISGAGDIIKKGPAGLWLGAGTSVVHIYTGNTYIYGGLLLIADNTSLPTTTNLVLNGGVLELYWSVLFSRTLGTGANQVQIPGGESGFSEQGGTTGTIRLNNDANFELVWGNPLFNPSAFTLQSDATNNNAIINIENKLDLGGVSRIIKVQQAPTMILPNRSTGIISGVIRNGNIIKTGPGALELRGANTFSGMEWREGTVQVNNLCNANCFGAGSVSVTGDVVINNSSSTFTGSAPINITSGKSLLLYGAAGRTTNLDGAISGAGVLETAASSGTFTVSLRSAANTFTGPINHIAGVTAVLNLYSLVDNSSPIKLGNGAAALTLGFQIAGPTTLTQRPLQLTGTTGTIDIKSNSASSTSTISLDNPFYIVTAGSKNLRLSGSNTGANRVGFNIADGVGSVITLQKGNQGVWCLSGTNTYSGSTDMLGDGVNGILVFQGTQALSPNTTLVFAQASSNVQGVRFLSDGVGTNLFVRPIQFGGTNTSQTLSIFVGNNNTANLGNSSGTTTGSINKVGTITFTSVATDTTSTSVNVTGANSYRLETGIITLNNLVTRTAGATTTTILNPTTANMTVEAITMETGNTGIANDGIPVLRLTGTALDNYVVGAISNASDYLTGQPLSVEKQGTGAWTLQGVNTYTGLTTITTGKLNFSGANSVPPASAISVGVDGKLCVMDSVARNATVSALVLSSGASLCFDWVGGASDQIICSSDIATSAGDYFRINLNPVSSPSGNVTLLTGGAGSSLNNANFYLSGAYNFTATLSKTATAVSVTNYSVQSPASVLYWQGDKLSNTIAGVRNALDLSDGVTSNWSSTNPSYTGAALIPGPTTDAVFANNQTGKTQQTCVFGSDLTLRSLTIDDATTVNISSANGSTLTLLSTSSIAGTAASPSSAVSVTSTSATSPSIGNDIILGGNQTWHVASGKTLTVDGIVRGNYDLTKASTGILRLNTHPEHLGETLVSEGELITSANATLASIFANSTGITLNQGAIFQVTTAVSSPQITIPCPVTLGGGAGTSTIRVSSTNVKLSFSNLVTGQAGVNQVLAVVQGYTVTAGEGQSIVFNGISDGSGGTLGVNINFAGASTINQSAFVHLNGVNTFTGDLTITNTRGLQGGSTNQGGWVTVGGITNTNSLVRDTGYLGAGGTYSGNISISAGSGVTTLCFASTGNQTLNGVISGSGRLVMAGVGVLTLTAANTYTGTTTVNSSTGILRIKDSIASNTTVTLGTLEGNDANGGSCTINGTITVANSAGANIRPGSFGNNIMNAGALTFSGSNSTVVIDSTATAMSKVAVTGDVALGGMGVIFNTGITTNGTYKIIMATGTMSGTLPSIITNSTGKTIVLQQTGNDLEAVVS